jgi:peptidoglycan/LPS O-acetylase OafA/YrhL
LVLYYALYLIHPLVATPIIIYWPTTSLHTWPILFVFGIVGLIAQALAFVIFRLIERPITVSLRWMLEAPLRRHAAELEATR